MSSPPKVLHLFNIFGALTERAMFDYTMGLAKSGFDLTIGYETLAPECPATNVPLVKLQRIEVQPTSDVASQMREIAFSPTPCTQGEEDSVQSSAHANPPRFDWAHRRPEYREREKSADPALRNLLDQKFQLIHGHFGPRLLQGAAWITRGTPMIISLYGYDMGRLLRDPTWIERYRWAAKQGVMFVVLARYMEQRLLALGIPAGQVCRITLGIDLDVHEYLPSPAPPKQRFVFIGRFVQKKGTSLIIEASHLLRRRGIEIQVDLIGSGPLEQALRSQAESHGLQQHVRFLGTVPFAQLFDHLRDCTALVQPSQVAADGDMEGAPMVLMSAQAVGVPCITTHHSGNPETIPPAGQGFVVPERNAEALAVAMERMIHLSTTHRRNLQDAGRAWIAERFNLRNTVAQYAQLYRALLDR